MTLDNFSYIFLFGNQNYGVYRVVPYEFTCIINKIKIKYLMSE